MSADVGAACKVSASMAGAAGFAFVAVIDLLAVFLAVLLIAENPGYCADARAGNICLWATLLTQASSGRPDGSVSGAIR